MAKRDSSRDHPNVMVSSTYLDLTEHRKAAVDALLRLGFFPIGMEFDSAKAGKNIVASSLEMVGRAQAYVGIVSHRYGGVPDDREANPEGLSITELEYRMALSLRMPVYMFLMNDKHPVTVQDVESNGTYRAKLLALRNDARNRSVCAEFSSVEEFKGLILQSMAELKSRRSPRARAKKAERTERRGELEPTLPSPPDLLAVPDFVSGHTFVGRRAELAWLDEWATTSDSLMVIEAIGGAGKSTLTWQWIRERANGVQPGFAGTLWYSFYEGGADMAALAAYALAYITGRPLKEHLGRKIGELAQPLVTALHKRPFLLVLDGLERVLLAYHRLDASQERDDQLLASGDDRACIKPADTEFLRQLVAAAPSKVLVTSRLMPTALTNAAGYPIPGVAHRHLRGMHPDDALAMMRDLGIRGDKSAMRRYFTDNFDNHPLLLGVVGGLIHDYIRDPGNFERWADDPMAGASLHLSALKLEQRRTHILAAALNGLESGVRQLLSRIAALAGAVSFETVMALNPFLPSQPKVPSAARSGKREALSPGRLPEAGVRLALPKLVSALQDLERRGLLQWDRSSNSYDLHPVVRGYAFDALDVKERTDIGNRLVDHFQSKPTDRYEDSKTLADVQQSVSLFRAFVQADRLEDATSFYMGAFSRALLFSIEAHHEVLALLKPVFADGFHRPPPKLTSGRHQSYLLTDVALALWKLERFSDAGDAHTAALRIDLDRGDSASVRAELTNFGLNYFDANKIARSFTAFELALELAKAIRMADAIARAHWDLMANYRMTGLFVKAEAAFDEFRRLPKPTDRATYRPGMAEQELCWLRFYEGTLTDKLLDEAEAVAEAGRTRTTLRSLCLLRGEFALLTGDISVAITTFERHIEMTQSVGMPVHTSESRLAVALARAGRHQQARGICDRLRESARPPHVGLASAYLELGHSGRARSHALAGHSWAWADGPPYTRWWELGQCRAVLKTLSEPEPSLLAFNPMAGERIPYENEIRALITKVNEERQGS